MSSGPIEFLGEQPDRSVPETEFGGHDGMIQSGPASGEVAARADGMPLRHELSASEIRDVMTRAAGWSVEVTAFNEAEVGDLPIVDPVTGRVLEPDDVNVEVTGKPGREHGLTDGTWQ